MARGGSYIRKRELPADPIYGSRLVSRFVNRVMKDGKKSVAQRVVYGAFSEIKDKAKREPLEVFETALRNVSPRMEVRPRRVGGASYQVPMEVRGDRKEALAIRWILTAADNRPGRTFAEKLSSEIMDASQNQGGAIKRRDDTHRMAEANKAFAHFRW
jgi:small subunit ribosomal protein S7